MVKRGRIADYGVQDIRVAIASGFRLQAGMHSAFPVGQSEKFTACSSPIQRIAIPFDPIFPLVQLASQMP